jgi:HMG (high mobility group) box
MPTGSCSPLPPAYISTSQQRLRPQQYLRTSHRWTQSRGRSPPSRNYFQTPGSTLRGNLMPERNHLDTFHVLRTPIICSDVLLPYIADSRLLIWSDRNPFILFRTAFVRSGHVPAGVEPDHRNLSRIAGEVWRRMTATEKKKWNDLAEEVKEEHKREYPNYRYNTPAFLWRAQALLTRTCHRYQPDFHRPEPVRRRKPRRRVIVEEVDTDTDSEPGEDPTIIQGVEAGASSVQDGLPSSSSAVARNASRGPVIAITSKIRPAPCKRKAGAGMRRATGQLTKIKVRTVAVPERPREYLSKVAALVHAGHNGDALIQAVQFEPASAPISGSEKPVLSRQLPPLPLVRLPETLTPGELLVSSPGASEIPRQVSVTIQSTCIILHFYLPILSYCTRTSSDRVMYREVPIMLRWRLTNGIH